MKRISMMVACLALFTAAGTAKDKIKASVSFAPSWKAAVEEAKLLNVPLVIHRHNVYWGPCWGMHQAVLQNKKYMKFAQKGTVEVMVIGDIDEAIGKNDKRVATYKDKDGVERLVEWPSLTIKQVQDMNRSHAVSYKTRGVPYTVIVNPHDLSMLAEYTGGVPSKTVMEAVADGAKLLKKAHGKGVSRKALEKLAKQEAAARKSLDKGDLKKALADTAKYRKSVSTLPASLAERGAKLEEDVMAQVATKLDELEALLGRDKKQAARELGTLARTLKGTQFEERANDLLAKSKEE